MTRKRLSAVSATLILVGVGFMTGAEAAAAQGQLVDFNALLRLLQFFDLGPF